MLLAVLHEMLNLIRGLIMGLEVKIAQLSPAIGDSWGYWIHAWVVVFLFVFDTLVISRFVAVAILSVYPVSFISHSTSDRCSRET